MARLKSGAQVFTSDGVFSALQTSGVKDISFFNPDVVGGADAFIDFGSGAKVTILAGDPILTLGGYEGYTREDEIAIAFGAGTAKLIVLFNKELNC